MKIEKLKLHCLNAVCDDYENMQSINKELPTAIGYSVNLAQIEIAIKELVKSGLINAFVYDASTCKFNLAGDHEYNDSKYWYYISKSGRSFLDQNWVDH